MTHYERLGVARDATAAQIRAAYRHAARDAHPDRHGDARAAEMAAINEAYRVLSDPIRRRRYDEGLRGGPPGSAARPSAGPSSTVSPRPTVAPPDVTPARFPWRFMLGMFAVGVAIVIAGVILYDAPPPAPVDNVLRQGDCVTLSASLEAAEVSCAEPHDATVRALVPFDAGCPNGSTGYRDRQGMGIACVVLVSPAPPG